MAPTFPARQTAGSESPQDWLVRLGIDVATFCYVILAALARKYLSALPSSVALESSFSDAGIIDSNQR